MKAILEFDMTEYLEKLRFNMAVSATDAYLVMHHLDNYLRSELKYKDHKPEVWEALEAVRNKLGELQEEYNINMGNLE